MLKRLSSSIPGEAPAAMSHVENNPPFPAKADFLDESRSTSRNKAVLITMKAMRQDVPRSKLPKYFLFSSALTDVDHQWNSSSIGCFQSPMKRCRAVTPSHTSDTNFHPDGPISIRVNNGGSLDWSCIPQFKEFFSKWSMQTHERNMNKRQDVDLACVYYSPAKFRKIGKSCCTRVNCGGYAMVEAVFGIDSIKPTLVPVAVKIDEAWTNIRPGGVTDVWAS